MATEPNGLWCLGRYPPLWPPGMAPGRRAAGGGKENPGGMEPLGDGLRTA
jgi:hypothetical protein